MLYTKLPNRFSLICEFSILLHWPICQTSVPRLHSFKYYSNMINLLSDRVSFSTLLLFKNALDFLCTSHISFRTGLSNWWKTLLEFWLELYQLWLIQEEKNIFTISSNPNLWTGHSSSSIKFYNFFHKGSLVYLLNFLHRYFIFLFL